MKSRTSLVEFTQRFLFAIILFLCLLVSCIGVVFVILRSDHDDVEKNTKSYQYQILEYDPRLNETSYGMVTLLNPIEGDYKFKENPSGNFVLISNFGTEEFECTGVCFCEKDESERKSTSILFQKPMFYLLATLTSAIAYKLAKTYFEDKCLSDLRDGSVDCVDENSINSEVLECKESVRNGAVPSNEENEDDLEGSYFQCNGYCAPVESYSEYLSENFNPPFSAKSDDCYFIEFKSDVEVEDPTITTFEESFLSAQQLFGRELNSFCRGWKTVMRSFEEVEVMVDQMEVKVMRKYEFGEDYKGEDDSKIYKDMIEKIHAYPEWYEKSKFKDQGDVHPEKYTVCVGDSETVKCRKTKKTTVHKKLSTKKDISIPM